MPQLPLAESPRSLSSAAFDALRQLLGTRASASDSQRQNHSAGESYHLPGVPDVVCFPHSTQEVSAIVKIGAQYKVPVVPFGAGTSVEGHVNAVHGGIAIDLREMNKVLAVSPEDMDATVQAGITRTQLTEKLKTTGLTFFIDPGADATIGGMVATRASGTTAVRYGTMRENVLGLTVVLADGRIIHTGSHARKSSAGYDLTHLFVGSEGTLGVITEVILRLHAQPEAISAAVCNFPTIKDAVDAAIEAIQLGVGVARVELLDERQVDAVNRYSHTSLRIAPTLFFEFHGLNARDISDRTELMQEIAAEHNATNFQWHSDQDSREDLWKARHDAYHASHALRPGSKVWSTDVCVPISRLAECIVETQKDFEHASFPATIVGHVGDGNFHVLCMLDASSNAEMTEAASLVEQMVHRALAMGGTCTGEHGVGIGKMKYLRAEHGEGLDVMRLIKESLDPENRMNPGKVIDLSAPK